MNHPAVLLKRMTFQSLPTSGNLQTPDGTFFWSPDGTYLAYLHSGVIDLWHFGD